MADVKAADLRGLITALDLALPECYWRKRFLTIWRSQSLSFALVEWKKGPIVNPSFVSEVETIVGRMLDDSTGR